jgi:hypothetical protein
MAMTDINTVTSGIYRFYKAVTCYGNLFGGIIEFRAEGAMRYIGLIKCRWTCGNESVSPLLIILVVEIILPVWLRCIFIIYTLENAETLRDVMNL